MIAVAFEIIIFLSLLGTEMDARLISRLKKLATFYYGFLSLSEADQEWLMPGMSRSAISTIKLLKLLSERPYTFEELASELGMNPQSISQRLNALSGEIPLDLSESGAFLEIGRPRKLVRLKK